MTNREGHKKTNKRKSHNARGKGKESVKQPKLKKSKIGVPAKVSKPKKTAQSATQKVQARCEQPWNRRSNRASTIGFRDLISSPVLGDATDSEATLPNTRLSRLLQSRCPERI